MLKERIKRVRRLLREEKIDAILIAYPVDLFYFTGKQFTLGRLLITKKSAELFVDARYYEGCRDLDDFEVILSPNFRVGSPFGKRLSSLAPIRLGFDGGYTNYAHYQELVSMMDGSRLCPLTHPIQKIRMIKDAEEIALLKKAGTLNKKGFDFLKRSLVEGVTEKQLTLDLEIFWLKNGGEGLAFSPIIAFGAETAVPHHYPSETKLKKGDTVLFDIGVKIGHYHSDMTRTLFFGKPRHIVMKEIYFVVEQAQELAFSFLRPGMSVKKIDALTRAFITKAGYGEFFPHGLGHGVGLEIHELPVLKKEAKDTLLEEGMVVTIEPGVYLPQIGGVRIEDTVLITKRGYQFLTR